MNMLDKDDVETFGQVMKDISTDRKEDGLSNVMVKMELSKSPINKHKTVTTSNMSR